MTREDLVKLAREIVGGIHRPEDECSTEGIDRCGHLCPLAVTNPAAFDPPEWVLEAMKRAYERGDRDGYSRCLRQDSLYPEGG